MEFQINYLPFEMNEISDKLFNKPFLSDVTFTIEGKRIFAHSLELMKRSIVFQQQLESALGEKKLIPIIDYGYDVFHQFIRFIYTDKCDISEKNCFELLKLAKVYKVIRLLNVIQNSKYVGHLEMLDFCVVQNYKIPLNCAKRRVAFDLQNLIARNEFLSVHSDTVEEILTFDQIRTNCKETDIIDAVVRWLNHHCIQNQIHFTQCREKFNKLIRLIRFPILSKEMLLHINTKYPELLTKTDMMMIGSQKFFGRDCGDNGMWISTPRMGLVIPYEWKEIFTNSRCDTKFSVTSEMILRGFVFGTSLNIMNSFNITIACQNSGLAQTPINIELNKYETSYLAISVVISLGSSIRIRPNYTYTIGYTFTNDDNCLVNQERHYFCRKPQSKIIISSAPNLTVKILEAHETMHEILFMKPDDKIN